MGQGSSHQLRAVLQRGGTCELAPTATQSRYSQILLLGKGDLSGLVSHLLSRNFWRQTGESRCSQFCAEQCPPLFQVAFSTILRGGHCIRGAQRIKYLDGLDLAKVTQLVRGKDTFVSGVSVGMGLRFFYLKASWVPVLER